MTMESHLYWCHLWLKILPASDPPHLREGAGLSFYRQETMDAAQPWSQDQSLGAHACWWYAFHTTLRNKFIKSQVKIR